MGKMTNAFEALLAKVIDEEPIEESILEVQAFHENIIKDLELSSNQVLREDLDAVHLQFMGFIQSILHATGYGKVRTKHESSLVGNQWLRELINGDDALHIKDVDPCLC